MRARHEAVTSCWRTHTHNSSCRRCPCAGIACATNGAGLRVVPSGTLHSARAAGRKHGAVSATVEISRKNTTSKADSRALWCQHTVIVGRIVGSAPILLLINNRTRQPHLKLVVTHRGNRALWCFNRVCLRARCIAGAPGANAVNGGLAATVVRTQRCTSKAVQTVILIAAATKRIVRVRPTGWVALPLAREWHLTINPTTRTESARRWARFQQI